MDPDFAALNMGGQAPGRNTRRFTMSEPFPARVGMSPELAEGYGRQPYLESLYKYGGG
jgi:hypothetical protein